MLKKERKAEEKRKAQGVTYPAEQKVITPKTGAANAAPTIVWKQDGNLNFKSGNSKVDNQTVITAMEAVYDEPDYVNISISGGQKWKKAKNYEDNLTGDSGFKRFQEFMTRNNFSGTVEGISAIPLMLGKDHSRYEPQKYWTSKQRNTFNYYYNDNPENAKKYAQAVNDEYKRMNEEKTAQWAVEHPMLATSGAWVADQIGVAETQHNELTYARDGQLPYTTQVTPGRYSTIVREAIREDLDETSGDRVSGDMYAAIDGAVNSAYYGYLQKIGGPFGMAIGAMNHYSNDYNNALYEAKARGATNEEAIQYARGVGAAGAVGSLVSDRISKKLGGNDNVMESMLREGVSNTVGGPINRVADYVFDQEILGKNSEYNGLVTAYMAAGKSQTEAEELAGDALRRKLLRGTLDDLAGGLAYGLGRSDNTVKRSLFK